MSSVKSTKGVTVTGPSNNRIVSLLNLGSTYALQKASAPAGQIPASSDITCCVALYVKIEGYEGPLFELRRSSDGVTTDIYSMSEVADFLSGGEGTIASWNDQTGNNNNFTQSTAGSQPILQIENSTTLLPTVQLTTNRSMTGALAVTSGDYSIVYHIIPTNIGAGGARAISSASANWLMGPYSSNLNMYAGGFAGGVSVSNNDSLIHTGYKTSGGNTFHRINGSETGGSAGATYPAQFNLGLANIYGEPALSSVSEIVILNVAATERMEEIEASLTAKYPLFTL